MIRPELLLFIEPNLPPSKEPVLDLAVQKMVFALEKAQTGSVVTLTPHKEVFFDPNLSTRGFHLCSCGAASTNVDYLLPGGEITNSLAAHYLAWHREEVPEEQIERVLKLPVEVESSEFLKSLRDRYVRENIMSPIKRK